MGLRGERRPWQLDGLALPWAPHTSIYETIRAALSPEGEPLPAELALPDDGDGDDDLRWVPGAMDGVVGHHGGASEEDLRPKQVTKAILDLLDAATDSNLRHLYDLLASDGLLHVVDAVFEELARKSATVDLERLPWTGCSRNCGGSRARDGG